MTASTLIIVSYDDARRILGLNTTALFPTPKTTSLPNPIQVQDPDEDSEDHCRGSGGTTSDVASTCVQMANTDEWQNSIDNNGTFLATNQQGFRFEDSMERNGWEWDRFFDFSHEKDQAPSGIES